MISAQPGEWKQLGVGQIALAIGVMVAVGYCRGGALNSKQMPGYYYFYIVEALVHVCVYCFAIVVVL